jgi:hypothetical protein
VSATYVVEVFKRDRADWLAELENAISTQVHELGLHRSVSVEVRSPPVLEGPCVSVYMGSPAAAADAELLAALTGALDMGRSVIPVVESLREFSTAVPRELYGVNGWEWSESDAATRLARKLLEELGVQERHRRVFISHRREDGLAAAEQLHDYLTHYGFTPFIDRFAIDPGKEVQEEIADALENFSFLLLLETPNAHTSDWVFYEVEYALGHHLGMHIVSWPHVQLQIPGTAGLLRQNLGVRQLRRRKGYDILSEEALDAVLAQVEATHAREIVNRRRSLLVSAKHAAEAGGMRCTPLPGWRLLVETPTSSDIVQVSTRLPTVDDLYELDQARPSAGPGEVAGLLVHSARPLAKHRRDLLSWATGERSLTLVPENRIGGFWI